MKSLRCIVGGFQPMRKHHHHQHNRRRQRRFGSKAAAEVTDPLDGKNSSVSSYRSIPRSSTRSNNNNMPVERLEDDCTQDTMLHFAITNMPRPNKKITRRHTADMGSLFDSDDDEDDDNDAVDAFEEQRPGLKRSQSTPIKIGPKEHQIVNAARVWQFVPKLHKKASKSRRHSMAGPTPLERIPEPAAAKMPRRHSTIGYMSWGNGAEDESVAISSVASEVTSPGGFDSFSSIDENAVNTTAKNISNPPQNNNHKLQTSTSTSMDNLDDLFSTHSGEQAGGNNSSAGDAATDVVIGGEVQFRPLYQDDTETRSVSECSEVSSPPPSLSIVSSDEEEMYEEDSIFSDDSTVRTGHNSMPQQHQGDAQSSTRSQKAVLFAGAGADAVSRSSKSGSSRNSLYAEEEDGETSTQSPSSSQSGMCSQPQMHTMDTMYDCIKALSCVEEEKVIALALKRLQKYLTEDPETVWYFVGAYGGIPQTVKVMMHCVDSPSIQSDSIALLCRIVDGSKRFAIQLLEAGAIDRTLDAVINFPVHRPIRYNSAGLMKRLAGALKGEHLLRLCSVCTPNVLQSLRMFDADMKMQKALGIVLWFFAVNKEGRRLILEMGGADAITNSLVKGVDVWKTAFLTLYQRLVQDHAKGHSCYTSGDAHQKCPFYN